MTLESVVPVSDNLTVKLPAVAARASRFRPAVTATDAKLLHHGSGHDRKKLEASQRDRRS